MTTMYMQPSGIMSQVWAHNTSVLAISSCFVHFKQVHINSAKPWLIADNGTGGVEMDLTIIQWGMAPSK